VEVNFHSPTTTFSMSIQHDAPDQLRNTLSDEHVAALKNLWQKNSTLTPTRAQNHYSLLDQQKNPLYTLEAIQQELDKLQANSARARTTAENRAARAANLLPPVVRTEAEDAGSRDSQPQSDEHSQQPGQVRVSVTDGNAIARFKISPNLPVDEFKARVQVALSLDPDDRRRMQLGYMTSEGWIVTHNDETWADALSDDVRSFQVRLVAGSGSLSSDAASSASTASSTAQPQRLAFEHDSRIQAQKQWEYENKLRTHIKDRVTAKLANDGTLVGSTGTTVCQNLNSSSGLSMR
jgi:hypothetical protein